MNIIIFRDIYKINQRCFAKSIDLPTCHFVNRKMHQVILKVCTFDECTYIMGMRNRRLIKFK